MLSYGCDRSREMGQIMKYLHWRGNSLYCRYPLPGYPKDFPLAIYTTGSKTDIRRCEAQGEAALASLRTKAAEGRLFDIKENVEIRIYNPTFRRLCRRYFCNRLRWQKSGMNDVFHLRHSYNFFGTKLAREITREDVENWRQKMIKAGAAVNTVNLRYSYLARVYSWSNTESKADKRLGYDPTIGMKKIKGANIRSFVLTKEKFERNYFAIKDGFKAKPGTRANHATQWAITPSPRFAMFYLALWETGRRPQEVSLYEWDMVHDLDIDGRIIHALFVPPAIAKTDEPDILPISDRLWSEMKSLCYRQGIIFRNANGDRWEYWDIHKRKLEKLFGADSGWIRDTRRGFVTHKCEVEGFDPAHVRAISGHRTESIFQRYRIGNLRNIANVVNPVVLNTNQLQNQVLS